MTKAGTACFTTAELWGNQGCVLNNMDRHSGNANQPRARCGGKQCYQAAQEELRKHLSWLLHCGDQTEDSFWLSASSSFWAQRFTSKAHCSHQRAQVLWAQLLRACFLGCGTSAMTHICGCPQLWNSGLKCMSIGWYTGVKGEVPYWVVLSCENELHH